jgi:hypothetical protein
MHDNFFLEKKYFFSSILFIKKLFREYTMLYIINTFFDIRKNYSFRKKEIHHRFKNLIITSEVKVEGNKEASIGKTYSNRRSQRKYQTFKKQRHQTQFNMFSNSSGSGD